MATFNLGPSCYWHRTYDAGSAVLSQKKYRKQGTRSLYYCAVAGLTTNSLFCLRSKFESSIFYERIVLLAAGIFLYPAELYAAARTDIPNSVRVAMLNGIFDERTPVGSFITRGAAVSKIVERRTTQSRLFLISTKS